MIRRGLQDKGISLHSDNGGGRDDGDTNNAVSSNVRISQLEQVAHVPSEMTESVEGVERSGEGDDGFSGNLGPSREFGKEGDEGRGVEGDAHGGEEQVSDEEGVHSDGETCAGDSVGDGG